MGMGDVVEGRGGKRYVQVGENPKDKASWKPVSEVSSVPDKPFEPSGTNARELGVNKEIAGGMLKTALYPFELLDEAAYKAGGYVTDKATALGAQPESASVLGTLTNLATSAVPSILGGAAFDNLVRKPAQGLGRWFMQKAIKPDKEALMSGDAAKAIETMLKEGRNVSTGSVREMLDEVKKLSGEVNDAVNAAQAQGRNVSVASVLGPVAKTRSGPLGQQINNVDDLKAIEKALSEFLNDARVAGKTEIPIRTAQDMKSATYKSLGSKNFGEMSSASVEGQKSIIRGLKEGIERSAPSVVEKNKRMQELLRAIEVVEPKALMAGNKGIGGLAYLAENPLAAGGFMLDRSSLINSILGRMSYSSPSILGVGAGGATAGLMQ